MYLEENVKKKQVCWSINLRVTLKRILLINWPLTKCGRCYTSVQADSVRLTVSIKTDLSSQKNLSKYPIRGSQRPHDKPNIGVNIKRIYDRHRKLKHWIYYESINIKDSHYLRKLDSITMFPCIKVEMSNIKCPSPLFVRRQKRLYLFEVMMFGKHLNNI